MELRPFIRKRHKKNAEETREGTIRVVAQLLTKHRCATSDQRRGEKEEDAGNPQLTARVSTQVPIQIPRGTGVPGIHLRVTSPRHRRQSEVGKALKLSETGEFSTTDQATRETGGEVGRTSPGSPGPVSALPPSAAWGGAALGEMRGQATPSSPSAVKGSAFHAGALFSQEGPTRAHSPICFPTTGVLQALPRLATSPPPSGIGHSHQGPGS